MHLVSRVAQVGLLMGVGLVAGFAGCGKDGPQRATVTGKITLDQQPLSEGSISFVPTGGTEGPVSGGLIKNGSYLIVDAVVGKQRVEIRGQIKTGKQIEAIPPAPPGTMIEVAVDIPAQYNSNSAIEVEIRPGQNSFDFPLSTK